MVFAITIDQSDNKIIKSTTPTVQSDHLLLFFSGTIYNHAYLKAVYKLESNTVEEIVFEIFKTQTDIGSIIPKINGIFSIVVVDKAADSIIAIRDRNGFGMIRRRIETSGNYTITDESLVNEMLYSELLSPGEIVIFDKHSSLSSTTYNDYEKQWQYWQGVRNRYVVTKHGPRFKGIAQSVSHLTTDQIIEFSSEILTRTNYPEKVEMFKFLQCVKMFEACEYSKLTELLKRALKAIVSSAGNTELCVLLDDSVSTTCIVVLLREIGVTNFKTFSVHNEFEKIFIPAIVSTLKTDHTPILYNPRTTPVVSTYIFCKHVGQLSDTPTVLLPTLASEIFSENPVADLTSETTRTMILKTTECIDKFNLSAHYPYGDIHVIKYALFLKNGIVPDRLLKMVVSQFVTP